jgi:hypothetical protein
VKDLQLAMSTSTRCACLVLAMCKEALSHVAVLEVRMQHLKQQYSPADGLTMEAGGEELVRSVLECTLSAVTLVCPTLASFWCD